MIFLTKVSVSLHSMYYFRLRSLRPERDSRTRPPVHGRCAICVARHKSGRHQRHEANKSGLSWLGRVGEERDLQSCQFGLFDIIIIIGQFGCGHGVSASAHELRLRCGRLFGLQLNQSILQWYGTS